MNIAEPAANILRSAAPSIQAAARSEARILARLARPCLAGLLFLPLSCFAADYGSIHLRSYHSNGGNYHERNIGLGVEIDRPGYWRIAAGAYVNSHNDTAVYLGPMFGNDYIALGALFLDGYDNGIDADRWWPMPAPVLRIRPLTTRLSPSVTFAPMDDGYVILTSLGWRF